MIHRMMRMHGWWALIPDLGAVGLAYWIVTLGPLATMFVQAWVLGHLHRTAAVGALTLGVFGLLMYSRYATLSRRWSGFGAELMAVLQVIVVGTGVLGLSLYLVGLTNSDKVLLSEFLLVSFTLVFVVHVAARLSLAFLRLRGHNLRYVVLVGHGFLLTRYKEIVRRNPQLGLQIARQIDTSDDGWKDTLRSIFHQEPVDGVVIALDVDDPAFSLAVALAQREGKDLKILLQGLGAQISLAASGSFYGLPVVTLPAVRGTNFDVALKRLLDLVGALVIGLVSSPCLVAAVLWIKVDDPKAPVLYRQGRLGVHGRRFVLYKLRTMVPNAHLLRGELAASNEMDGPVFKIRDDPRVTKPGRILRSLSLDEVPQLWNVLKGDMSLVGPRPPLPEEVEVYRDAYRKRLAVRPGITGPWQVSGRNQVSFAQWMDLDLEYVENWSLRRDIAILLRTVPVVLSRKGAS